MSASPSKTNMRIQTVLSQSQIDSLDAQLLLLSALGKDSSERTWLVAHGQDVLDETIYTHFFALCQSRLNGVPIAYLLESQAFFGLPLKVTPAVLIPRPDTETLIDCALTLDLPEDAKVLDLGAGSGAIALALKRERPHWRIQASDVSLDALAVAKENSKQLGLDVVFHHSHWFERIEGFFDLIVSNPPYIAEGDPHLPNLRCEPILALCSGSDGLDAVRQIVEVAPAFLCPQAYLLLEHGFDQGVAVKHLFALQGFQGIEQKNDLGGHVRATVGRYALP